MGARDERLRDLFFVTQTGNPSEEGQLRLDGTALKLYINSVVRSILAHQAEHHYNGLQPITARYLANEAGLPGKLLRSNASGYFDEIDLPEALPAELNFASSEAVDTTTSSTFLQKLKLTTDTLPSGDYILVYSWVTSGSNNNTGIESRVQQDDTTNIQLVTNRAGVAGAQYANSGFKVITGLSGVHDFDIDWRRESGAGDASILWARLALWLIDN